MNDKKPGTVTSLQQARENREQVQESSAQILESSTQIIALQHAINEAVKQERFASLPPETVGTAFLHYAARVGCQLGMNSKDFAIAAKEAFKAVAKELRG